MTFLFLLLQILLLAFLAYKLYNNIRFKLPPGPKPKPILGNLNQIKPIKFRCYSEWSKIYGPIISVWFGSTLYIIVNNTELAREVLKDNDQQLADRERNRSSNKMSKNGKDLIWADYGPHYVKVRKFCTVELFSPKRLEALRPIREDEVTAMVENIYKDCTSAENKGKSLVLRKYIESVAFNNITRLVFGKRFVNEKGQIDEQGKAFKASVSNGNKLVGRISISENVKWLRWMFPLNEKLYAQHFAERDRLTHEIMDEHTNARKQSGRTKQHFVDALLTLKDQHDISDETVLGLLWDMIVAGTDTTAISVEWTMAELIKNPRVQKKAQEELDRVIGSKRVITENDISNLPYLQSIAKEGLRLHPPTPLMLPHKASSHVKVGGYDIPKGSVVEVNVWAIGRDPAIWKDPEEFRPERYLAEDIDMKGTDFRLLPFGSGRRVCPGAQLSIYLVTSMLGHLLHHFDWALPNGMKAEEIDMCETPGRVSYMRTPIQAIATPRLSSELYKRHAVAL